MDSLAPIASRSNVPAIQESLDQLWDSLEKSAASNIRGAAGDRMEFTQIEQRSLLRAEMLNLSKGIDVASILIKGRLIEEIEREGLATVHPGQYRDVDELCQDQGISPTEKSQIQALYSTIFPWIQDNLGLSPMEVWNNISKSNIKELVPVLTRIISGEEARESVEASYNHIMDDIYATALTAGNEITEEGARLQAVDILLEQASYMSNRDLRATLRPGDAGNIDAYTVKVGERTYLIASMDDRQEQMLARRLHGYWDPINLGNMDGQRVEEVRSIVRNQYQPLFRLANLITGAGYGQ
nr:hypothetical protein [Anaerolineae bacterium]